MHPKSILQQTPDDAASSTSPLALAPVRPRLAERESELAQIRAQSAFEGR